MQILEQNQSTWQLQEAKNKLSAVVEQANAQGPQVITKRGIKTAVVISYEQFEAWKEETAPKTSLVEFFRNSPLVGLNLDLERDSSPVREITL